jgi:Mn-dependent DtxR family transcriptional regulator
MDVQFNQTLKTGPLVAYLKDCYDQVASVEEIAQDFGVGLATVRDALSRLARVGRVAEIHTGLWHLE